jgi:hypothetical protein
VLEEQEEQHTAAKVQQHGVNGNNKMGPQDAIVEVNQEGPDGLDEEDQMRILLGFTGEFGSTVPKREKFKTITILRAGVWLPRTRRVPSIHEQKEWFQ